MNQQELEQKYQEIKDREKDINDLSEEELRILLAFEMWNDGMDWEDIQKIEHDSFWTVRNIITYLQDVFGY